MKILVVEDDPLMRKAAVSLLRSEGYEVVTAETGEQALGCCKDAEPDVLFTDIRLPGKISGWDVAERCRAANPRLPVIYASGFSVSPSRPVSGSVFFDKPYDAEQLVDTIRDLTGKLSTH
jgi:CheY-like chemotaxis protein